MAAHEGGWRKPCWLIEEYESGYTWDRGVFPEDGWWMEGGGGTWRKRAMREDMGGFGWVSEIFWEERDSKRKGFWLVFLYERSPVVARAERVLSGITIYSFFSFFPHIPSYFIFLLFYSLWVQLYLLSYCVLMIISLIFEELAVF